MRRMAKIFLFLISLLVLLSFLVSCGKFTAQEKTQEIPSSTQPLVTEELTVEENLTKTGCEYNSDCTEGVLCIDKECKTLASLYNTDCENKCTITAVKVKTSDDEKYDLSLGQGSYTAAGALEWRLLKTPDYCPGENPLVAVQIIKKTTGKILGEQILTLHEGNTSEEITHPTVKSVKFTAQLEEVTEECS